MDLAKWNETKGQLRNTGDRWHHIVVTYTISSNIYEYYMSTRQHGLNFSIFQLHIWGPQMSIIDSTNRSYLSRTTICLLYSAIRLNIRNLECSVTPPRPMTTGIVKWQCPSNNGYYARTTMQRERAHDISFDWSIHIAFEVHGIVIHAAKWLMTYYNHDQDRFVAFCCEQGFGQVTKICQIPQPT